MQFMNSFTIIRAHEAKWNMNQIGKRTLHTVLGGSFHADLCSSLDLIVKSVRFKE